MPTVKDKHRELVKSLYRNSVLDTIKWEMDDNGKLYSTFDTYTVHLRATRDSDGEPLEFIEVKNLNDTIVDSFNDLNISGSNPEIEDITTYYNLMVELRKFARRQALGADKAIDEILGKLSNNND